MKSLGRLIAVAVAYWLSARLGLALTAPPVFATAVWPPAGIALGAVLVWGLRVLPGIWLGALVANARFSWTGTIPLDEFVLAAGISVGACVQAALVARWIRRGARQGDAFKDDRSIIRLLVLAGPVGCCINASWGNGLLLWLDKTSLADFPINWATWWVGDTIGGLIFTPLTLIAFDRPRVVWRPMWRTVAIPLVLSFCLVMGLFAYASVVENRRRQTEFKHLADVATASLKSRMRNYEELMVSLKGLFDASEKVSCAEFQSFAQTLLKGNQAIQALEWAVWVYQDERKDFERGLWLCGNGAALITERDAEGQLVPAIEREAYLPVTYIEPLLPNLKVLGFDLISEAVRREAVEKARDQNRLVASPPIALVQDSTPHPGLLLVAPLFRKQAGVGRDVKFNGVVLGVMRFGNIVDDALSSLGTQRTSLRVRIDDEDAPTDGGMVYADDGFKPDNPLILISGFDLADRHWRLTLSGSEKDFGEAWSTWYVLAGGMCLSGLLGGFLLLLAGRTANMEGLVARRTADLGESNQRLREEIAERVKMEQEAKRLALVAEKSTSGIIITDAFGVIEWVNPAFSAITGYDFAEAVGHTPGELLQGPETDLAVVAHMDERITCQMGFDVEILNYRKNRESIWLNVKVDPVFDSQGRLTQFIGVESDISQRKEAEQALSQAKLAADKASQSKSEFLANMSHEIRTPMNGVLGMIELLRGTPLNAEQQELADIAGQSAESLMGIINDILDFSKIEAGKLKIDRIEFDLRELCETVCLLMAIPAHAKGLEFNCLVHPDLRPVVLGDPTRVRQVLVNLLSNAVKFTPKGEVSVDVRCLKQAGTECQIRFQVKDTGIGIMPTEMDRLFMPFEQAEQGDARRFGGTGLGLSISRSLVRLMGGELCVESVPTLGSTFWFTVCLEETESAAQPQQSQVLGGRKILAVDDNETSRAILAVFLSTWGATVESVENGRQALERILAAAGNGVPYDLLILDQFMPEMGGIELCRELARHPVIAATPRILLCSSGAPTETLSREAGISISLNKPVRQSQLFDAVAETFYEAGSRPIPAAHKEDIALPQFPDHRVLLVEDNPVNQRVALKMLERFGVRASLAATGGEALRALEENRFDLVFMDCQIPEMDGFTVTKALRERERAKGLERTPVLALTANAIAGDREKSIAAGMDDHLTKPLALKDLDRVLGVWLSGPRQAPLALEGEPQMQSMEPMWDAKACLENLGGDLDLLEVMKSLFVSEASKQMDLMTLGEEGANPAKLIGGAAHALRGIAGNFQAKSVMALCAQIEAKARTGNLGYAEPLIQALQTEVGRLIHALQEGGEEFK